MRIVVAAEAHAWGRFQNASATPAGILRLLAAGQVKIVEVFRRALLGQWKIESRLAAHPLRHSFSMTRRSGSCRPAVNARVNRSRRELG